MRTEFSILYLSNPGEESIVAAMWPGIDSLRRSLGAPSRVEAPDGAFDLQGLLADPITALFLSLLLGAVALSAKFSMSASRIMFLLAWAVGVFAMRNLPFVQFAVGFIALTFAMVALGFWARPEAVPQYFGRITPRRRLLFDPAGGGDLPRLEIGDSGAQFLFSGQQGRPLFNFFDKAELTIEKIAGRVMVSTKVTDQNGNIVAEIVRNEWRAPPPAAWDRNYSSDAVEVKGANGNIVLQVRALPDRIQLQGEWWSDPVYGVRLVKSLNGDGAAMMMFGPGFRPRPPEIAPIFRYPSETNLGRLA